MAHPGYGYSEDQLQTALAAVVAALNRGVADPSPLDREDTMYLQDAIRELLDRRAQGVPPETSPARWGITLQTLITQMQAFSQAGQGSRELSLAITKLQEAGHWLAAVRVPHLDR